MSYSTAIFTLLSLLFLIIYQIKIWKLRVVMSPAFYFAIIWSFGVIGCLVLSPVGFLYEPYPQYINELNILIAFTALCFILLTKHKYKKVNQGPIRLSFCTKDTFRLLTTLFLFAAIVDFIRLGGSFNVGGARQNLAEITAGRPTWIGYCQLLSLPLSMYAGAKFVSILSKQIRVSLFDGVFLCLPLVANLVFSLNVGGRVDFVYAFAQYLIGFSLGLPISSKLSIYKKYLKYLLFSGIFLVLFISAVGKARSEFTGNDSAARIYFEEMNPIVGALYGPVEYIIASYNGYQLRRVDAVEEDELGYGRYTFNGFINWNIPFAGTMGIKNASIAKALDIYYDNQETYDYKRELFYTTHSCYLTIIKDYGFKGAFLCIIFLTYLAHYFFILIQTKQVIKHACQLYFFFLFWNYWAKSNFYGTLSSTVLIPLYGFIICDLFRFVINVIRKRN